MEQNVKNESLLPGTKVRLKNGTRGFDEFSAELFEIEYGGLEANKDTPPEENDGVCVIDHGPFRLPGMCSDDLFIWVDWYSPEEVGIDGVRVPDSGGHFGRSLQRVSDVKEVLG